MKLVSYKKRGKDQLALLVNDFLYNVDNLIKAGPTNMFSMLEQWEIYFPLLLKEEKLIKEGKEKTVSFSYDSVELLAPVPHPTSCRDGYAFRQHVETARRNRNVPMIQEFDQYPVFYFTNHRSIKGPGKIVCMPDHFEKLDFELEVAIVICKQGINIKAEEADQYIGGLMIMNDFSARTLQVQEMLLNLGPAKGKDFATAIGPCLVTLDELKDYEFTCKEGHVGKNWNLKMKAGVNGKQVSEGNLADMDWTFAEIIERASYGVDLYPGDIIGSGTVGSGCFLELNGTSKLNDANYKEQWLKDGDIIDLKVDQLGILTNTIVALETEHSILNQKKTNSHKEHVTHNS
jgi:fumarylacetoacetate (FAA) hydrolase